MSLKNKKELFMPSPLLRSTLLVCAAMSSLSALAQTTQPASQPSTASQNAKESDAISISDVGEITVEEKKPMTAASSGEVRQRDFLLRPHLRPADILMSAPGVFVVQHSGGGKANQYFLRGFDCDHGTDLRMMIDGVPVNMVSHGHGQGYTDLHFVIPELIDRVDVQKGPYFAEYGDFATAGAFNLITKKKQDKDSVSFTIGGYAAEDRALSIFRTVAIAAPNTKKVDTLIAAEVYNTDGPFENAEDLTRYNLFTKASRQLDSGGILSLVGMAYGAGWNGSGQIPERAINDGTIGRFGTLDPTEGGNSQRHSLYLSYLSFPDPSSKLTFLAYLVDYRFRLYSNFTFFSRDPVNGDQIEQEDIRTIGGLKTSYDFLRKWKQVTLKTKFGVEFRGDSIQNSLFEDVARERVSTVVDADIQQGSFGVFAQEDLIFSPKLRAILGLRGDYFGFNVTDNLEDTTTLGNPTSGVAQDSLASPKATLVYSPNKKTDLYLNFGTGFHSNDARGIVQSANPVTPLSRATGGEIGFRTNLGDSVDLAWALFAIYLGSELVWVGDEGVTEASGATLRSGVEMEGRVALTSWLYADIDATLSRGEFTQDQSAVALAPTSLLSGGLSMRHPKGYLGRIGIFNIGDRAATEDRELVAEGFTRVDLSAAYEKPKYRVGLDIQNLFNTEWREAQFATTSRLQDELAPADCAPGTRPVEEAGDFVGCEEVHFTPGAPFNAQLSLTLFF